jgi:hypothetical protein
MPTGQISIVSENTVAPEMRERGEKRKGGQGLWLRDLGDGGVHLDASALIG